MFLLNLSEGFKKGYFSRPLVSDCVAQTFVVKQQLAWCFALHSGKIGGGSKLQKSGQGSLENATPDTF